MTGLRCPNCDQMTRHIDGVHEFCSAGCPIRNEPGDMGDTIIVQRNRFADTEGEDNDIVLLRHHD